MDLQYVLQTNHLFDLAGVFVHPIDLFQFKVFAKDVPVFLAEMGS